MARPNPQTQMLLALIQAVKNSPVTPASTTSPVSNHQTAQAILAGGQLPWGKGAPAQPKPKGGGGPSVLGRILDISDRLGMGVREGLHRITDPGRHVNDIGDILAGISGGLSGVQAGIRGDVDTSTPGAQKIYGADILKEHGIDNKWTRALGGLALDVGLDPLTYVGPGVIKGAVKAGAGKVGIKVGEAGYAGTRAVEEAPPTLTLVKEARKGGKKVTAPTGITAEETGELAFKPATGIIDRIVDNPVAIREIVPKPRNYAPITDAGEISRAQKLGSEYIRKLKIKDNFVSPRQQGLLFRNLLKKTGNDWVRSTAYFHEIARFVESQGVGFGIHDGSKGTLAHAIDEVGGPKKFNDDLLKQFETGRVTDKSLAQGIENMRARSAMGESPRVHELLDQVAREQKMADDTLNAPTAEAVKKTATKMAKKQAQKELLISPAGVKTVETVLNEMERLNKGRLEIVLGKNKKILDRVVGAGDTRGWKPLQESSIHAKEAIMGGSLEELGQKVWGNRPFVDAMISLHTWYKNTMLRPFAQETELSARASAAARLKASHSKIGTKTQPEIDAAWKAAQGYIPAEGDELAKYMDDSMSDLFGTSGIGAEAGSSVAERSGLTMKDINDELGKMDKRWPGADKVEFKQGQIEDPLTGAVRDYTGKNWTQSWKSWQVSKPQEAMYRVQTAVEAVTKKYAMLDSVVGRWGSKVSTGDFKYLIKDKKHGLWRLGGYYFPKEVAEQLPVMFRQLDSLYNKHSAFTKLLDEVLSSWKRGVTIYVPAHHVRNLTGDVWNAWFDGVTDPRWYKRAVSVLKANHHLYEGAHISELVGKGAVERAAGKGRVLFHTKNGIPITDQMAFVAAHQHGLMLSSRDIEDLFGKVGDVLGDEVSRWRQPFKGNVYKVASGTAELREHFAILAHFMNRVARSEEKRLEDIYKDAAWYVRKYHPNGTDISQFERDVIRRVIPFYSWTRKAIPLVIEQILFNPRKVLIPPRVLHGVQTGMGMEGTTIDNPFPVDQAFPDFLREGNIGPIGLAGAGGLSGLIGGLGRRAPEQQLLSGAAFGKSDAFPGVDIPNVGQSDQPFNAYTVAGVGLNPLNSIFGQFTPNPAQGATEMLNPLLQTLVEVGTNRKIPGGAPVAGSAGEAGRYIAEQIPGVSPLYRILNRPGTKSADFGRPINVEALLNTLFASGITGTGPFVSSRQRRAGFNG